MGNDNTWASWGTIRVAERPKFLIIDRRTIRDRRLSFKARGVLAWILDQPEGTAVNRNALSDASDSDGPDSMRSALAELRDLGYIVQQSQQDESGKFRTTSIVYELPPEVDNPPPGNPTVDNPPPERVLTAGVTDTPPTPQTGSGFPSPESVRLRQHPYPPSFTAAFQAYPRRIAKHAGYKAWLARVNDAKKQGVDQQRRIDALHSAAVGYAAECETARREPEHIMHPSTFWGPSDRWRDFVRGNIPVVPPPARDAGQMTRAEFEAHEREVNERARQWQERTPSAS